jgi:outer membrane receptor protein involved in Fe transport
MVKILSLQQKLKIIVGEKLKNYLRLFILTIIANLVINFSADAQSKTISGTVTDGANSDPLIGVSIIIKGTTTGTISDIDGKFSLEANTGDVLVFSFIGYLNAEVTVANQANINVSMETDMVGLDEVVVIGYGVQKKKLNTGATVNVKGEDIEKMNTATPMDALKGISAGVTITQNNGVPGSGTKVLIRGAGTIDNSGPLYVVDGVSVGDIDFLSPSDIESIDVLKDAAYRVGPPAHRREGQQEVGERIGVGRCGLVLVGHADVEASSNCGAVNHSAADPIA